MVASERYSGALCSAWASPVSGYITGSTSGDREDLWPAAQGMPTSCNRREPRRVQIVVRPMNVSLNRIILYVQDVGRLADFYRDAFGLPIIEEIKGEWAVLEAGCCEI